MKNLTGSVLALAFLGALGILFAFGAGYWYVAHHLAWWTFALVYAGVTVGYQTLKEIGKEARKSK